MRIREEQGFTLVELMVVVLIIGILVSLAIPVFNAVKATASHRACMANQRLLEGAANNWVALTPMADRALLAGIVNRSHPVVTAHIVRAAPSCSSAATPADPDNPTAAEGAYTFDANGAILPCTFGFSGPHGHY